MRPLARSDKSILGRWWWTVDRWTLGALLVIMGFGILLIQAATPTVAVKHGLDSDYFIQRHLEMLVPAILIIFSLSLVPPSKLRWVAAVLLV
ncbi:MAG TPA: cell division protein FtsW, partial [Alphaproteobacteria bacterium]|nr:cell division protein FtsW [Alphaproteobacteria bacterium]